MKKYLPLISTFFLSFFLSLQSYSQIDNFPGTALAFDGENDYVSGTGIDTTLSAITIETWIYHNSLPAEVQRYVTIKPEIAVLRFDGTQYGGYHSLHFYIKKSNGSMSSIRVDSVLVADEWMHIAGTYDGNTMKLYLNGELLDTHITNGGLYHPDGDFSFSSSGSPLDGKMEEVRLWSIARTEQEIRENMYLPLSGNETGLVSYWQFNDESGDTLAEPISNNYGILYNMADADWVNSTIPFGAGNVNTQIVSGTGNVVFTNTNLNMNFTAKTGTDTLVVTKIEHAPNVNPNAAGTALDIQYWEINKFGNGSFTANISFTVFDVVNLQPQNYSLYKRDNNSDESWGFVCNANSVDSINKTITFNSISEAGQYIICKHNPQITLSKDFNQFDLINENFCKVNDMTSLSPNISDIDHDGLLDLLNGELQFYINHKEQASYNSSTFNQITINFNSIRIAHYTTPDICDIDHDGLLDLLIGEAGGNINHYEQDSLNSYTFNLVTNHFDSIDVGTYSAPDICDIDHDGLLDLLIGEQYGQIKHYEQASPNSYIFNAISGNFNSIDAGSFSKPKICDLDNDGLLDLLIGAFDGTIKHYEQASQNSNTFSLVTDNFNSIDVGQYSAPEICDIDHDGLLDLLIGEHDDNINRYEQTAIEEIEFGNILIGGSGEIISYLVKGTDISSGINLSCSSAFQISLSRDGQYSQSLTIEANSGNVGDSVFVKFTPTQKIDYSSSLIHTSSGAESKSISLVGRGRGKIDNHPGTVLEFDGNNNYVDIGNDESLDVGNTLTVEVWIKPTDLSVRQGIYSTRLDNAAGSFQLDIGPGANGTNRVSVTGINTWVAQTGDNAIALNRWNHIVYTRSGTGAGMHKIYVNGEEKTLVSDADYTFIDNTSDKVIASGTNGGQLFKGEIDELRLWNVVLPDSIIRENRYMPLTGNETGLVSYWQFNSESGTSLSDPINDNNGTLHHMADTNWVNSSVPFGPGDVNTKVVSSTGNVVFANTGASMNFTAKTGTDTMVITGIERAPNINPDTVGTTLDNQYWEIEKFGNGTFTANISFTVSEVVNLSSQHYSLYKRDNNSGENWTFVCNANGVDGANKTITFNSISEAGQFVICTQDPQITFVKSFNRFDLITNNFNSIVATSPKPETCDIDNDGLLDLLIGAYNGKIIRYEQASKNSNNFNYITNNFSSIDVGEYSSPAICDIDHDGLLDLLIGAKNGKIIHYEQTAQNSNTFSLVTDNFNSIDVGQYSAPEICDIDNDGLLDLLIGRADGRITHYEQVSENSNTFRFVTNNFSGIDVGSASTPEICDLDNDGLLDLLIGENEGYINHYEQISENSNTFSLVTNNFNSIDVGDNSTPEICDIDNDGLLDLLIGASDNKIKHYEQTEIEEIKFGATLLGNSRMVSYLVKATDISSELNLSCSSAFQISLCRDSLYSQSLAIQAHNGKVMDTVFVKFTPTQETVYSSNLTHTSGAKSKNLPLSGSGKNGLDSFPGTALNFMGDNDYVNVGHKDSLLDVGNTLTIEVWVKPTDLSSRHSIYSTRYHNDAGSFQLEIGPGNGGTNRVAVTGSGETWVAQTGDSAIALNEWSHIVYTRSDTGSGTHKIFVNGEEKALVSDADYTFIDNTSDKVIALGGISGYLFFKGKIDELRLWNIALPDSVIRENTYLPLMGDETGLVSCWQFNDESGDTLIEPISGNDGTLTYMDNSNWVNSTLPFGKGFSNTQKISTTGNYSFTNCSLSMNVTAKTGTDTLVISKIEHAPNINPDTIRTTLDNQYWEINKFGGGTFTADISFVVSEIVDLQPQHYSLYKRDNNSDESWEFVCHANNVDSVNRTITFNSISKTGQYIICEYNPRIIISKDFNSFNYKTGEFSLIDVGDDSSPEIYDIDQDGLLDLLIGNDNGKIKHYEQDSVNSYSFSLISDEFNSIDVGELSAPEIVDIDHDGLLDLLVGERQGNINLYEQDSVNSYTFNLITENFNSIDVYNGYSTPEICDIDHDGLLDLLVGQWNGKISHYEQKTQNSHIFNLITNDFDSIDVGASSKPEISDLDNDGLLDLFIGGYNGKISHYEQASKNSNTFNLVTNTFNLIDVGDAAAPKVYDIDNDGLLDLLVGKYNGKMNHYEQLEAEEIDFDNVLLNASKIIPYEVKGTDISSEISLSCSSAFQLSIYRNSQYSQTLTLQPDNGIVGDTVFVKFTPTQVTDYSSTLIHTSSGAESKNLLLSGSGKNIPDGFPGTALEFDGTDDYVDIGNSTSLNVGNALTIEAWVKPDSLSYRQSIYSTRLENKTGSFQLEIGPGNGGNNRVSITGPGTWIAETGDNVIDTNKWYHIVYTRTTSGAGKQKIYINGTEQQLITDATYEFTDNASDKVIASGMSGGQLFCGKIDELRLWKAALPDSVIRENMYLRITGTESDLVSYWQFNNGSGNTLVEPTSHNDGTLHNMNDTSWVKSTIPFGSGYSNTQIVSSTGNVIFTNTDVSMNFTAKTGTDTMVVSEIDTTANVNPASVITVFDDQYWVIDHFGSGTFTTDLQFTTTEDLTTEDQNAPGRIDLYTRESNSDSVWSFLAKASSVDASENKALFSNISTSGQFIITRGIKPGNNTGDALDFDGTEDYVKINKELSNTLSADTAITIEYWFKGSQMQSAVRIQNGNGYIVAGWGAISPQFLISTDGGTLGISAGDENIIEDGNWHHLAMTWQKNTTNGFVSYLDGELVFQRNSADVNLPVFSDDTSYLGSYRGNAEFLNGKLDEVSIWTIALDSTQIRESIHKTLTGTENGLVAYWQFNEGSGTSTADCIGGNDGILMNMTDDNWVPSTAPLPFTTVANGNWEQDTIWDEGQNVPIHPWSRVKIKHHVTLNSNMQLIEINIDTTGVMTISTGDTLTVTGH